MSGTRSCLLALVVLSAALTQSTVGIQLDRDPSRANPLQAGSMDLKLSEVGPATQNSTTDDRSRDTVRDTWEDYAHKNGTAGAVNNTLELANGDTTVDIAHVNVTATYVENDSALLDDGDPVATAASLTITAFRVDGVDHRSAITDHNGNGDPDVDDLANQRVQLGGIAANDSAALTLEIAGDAAVSASLGGDDGLDFTLCLTAVVDPSWRDADRSLNNTIQYESE